MNLNDCLPHGFDTHVYCVPEGTVVGQDNDGNDMIVTDTTVVHEGNKVWCTERLFNKIKEMTAKRLS